MKKLFAILIISLIVIGGTWFYFQERGTISEEISTEQFKNLGSIILENTKFKEFRSGNFYFRYPDWQKIEMDPKLLWPEEISQKQEILLYLTNFFQKQLSTHDIFSILLFFPLLVQLLE